MLIDLIIKINQSEIDRYFMIYPAHFTFLIFFIFNKMSEVITITFGDCSENHQGMEQIGIKQKRGYSKQNMLKALDYLKSKGCPAQIIQLHHLIDEKDIPNGLVCGQAYILYAKNGLEYMTDDKISQKQLHKQLKTFQWDSKYFDQRRQKVLNKHARKNVCFGQKYQKPDFQNKKGTIIPWKHVPILSTIRQKLNEMMDKNIQYQAQGNFYTDGGVKTTGVGYHGDAQRKMVVAIRTGDNSMNLHYQWFYDSKKIGKNYSIKVSPGDLYVMSEKAVGTDWKRKSILTLRHATGASKYTTI